MNRLEQQLGNIYETSGPIYMRYIKWSQKERLRKPYGVCASLRTTFLDHAFYWTQIYIISLLISMHKYFKN